MIIRTLALVSALALSPFATAADINLVTPTGAVVACDAIGQVKQSDMPRLFGLYNADAAHTAFVRFRTYGPRDCQRPSAEKIATRETLSGAHAVLAQNTQTNAGQ